MSQGHSPGGAARLARVGRATVYEWRDADSEFARLWDQAVEEGTDYIEDEAMRRAVQGVGRPVFYKGKAVGTIQEFSDTLIVVMLKARRPHKYRERFEHSGPDGQPLGVVLLPQAPASVEEWQQLVEQQTTSSSQGRKPS